MTVTAFNIADFGVLIRNPQGDADPAAFGPTAQEVVDSSFTMVDMLMPDEGHRTIEVAQRNADALEASGVKRRRHCMWSNEGETYPNISHACTYGLLNRGTRKYRIQQFDEGIKFAAAAGFESIGVHSGSATAMDIDDAADVYREQCKKCADAGIKLALETGAISGQVLAAIAAQVDHEALILNLDPANYLWYLQGNPLDYLNWVAIGYDPQRVTMHAKDINVEGWDPSHVHFGMVMHAPGKGCGAIDWLEIARWCAKHKNFNPWAIEHEPSLSGGDKTQQMPEIVEARVYLEETFAKLSDS